MKNFTLMMFALLCSLMSFAQGGQTTFTWAAENGGFDDQAVVAEFNVTDDMTATAAKGNGSSDPKYYDNGKSVRLYKGNTLTLAGPGITKISFTFSGGKKNLQSNVGTLANDVWTGSADEIVFSVPDGQARIEAMEVTYAGTGNLVNNSERVVEDVVVTVPEGLQTETWTLEGYFSEYQGYDEIQTPVNRALKVGFDGKDVYVQGLSYYLPEAWIKGLLSEDGKQITFNSPQYYGSETYANYSRSMYFLIDIYNEEMDECPESYTFDYDAEAGTITVPQDVYIMENAQPERNYNDAYGYYIQPVLHKGEPTVEEVVELPEGLTADEYHMQAVDGYFNTEHVGTVYVAIDGADVYLQGLEPYLPKAWAKGVLQDGTITVEGGQFLGHLSLMTLEYDLYTAPMAFTYDAQTGTLKADYYQIANDQDEAFEYFLDVTLTKINDVPGVPVTPSVASMELDEDYGYYLVLDVPLVSTAGNFLSAGKMSYQIYYDVDGTPQPFVLKKENYEDLTEDMSVIPYEFTDDNDITEHGYAVYLNGVDVTTWKRVGVKSIYTGGGETHESEIGWLSLESADGIVNAGVCPDNVRYVDVMGRRADGTQKGLLIRQERMADGSVKNVKVIRK